MTSYIYVEEHRVSEIASDALDNIISYREEKKQEVYQKWLEHKNEKTLWRNIFGYPKYDDSYESVKKYHRALDDYVLAAQFNSSVSYIEKAKDGVTTVLTKGQYYKYETFPDLSNPNVKYTPVRLIPPCAGFFNTPEKVEFDSYS